MKYLLIISILLSTGYLIVSYIEKSFSHNTNTINNISLKLNAQNGEVQPPRIIHRAESFFQVKPDTQNSTINGQHLD